ncbi:N2227-like protein-domain-containing protein [Aspergillus unguis]
MRSWLLLLLTCVAATAAVGIGDLAGGWEALMQVIVSNSTTIPIEETHPDPNFGIREEEEYASLQSRLSRSTGTWNANHPRHRLLTALYGFSEYRSLNLAEVKRWRDLYKHVPASQKKVVERVTGYTRKLNTVEHLFEENDKLAGDVLKNGMEFYGIGKEEFEEFVKEFKKEKKADRTSVVQAMKHFVRDWSEEGKFEREDAFACVLAEIQGIEHSGDRPVKVLLPGAGAGRLGYEINALGGFQVTINEWSAYMNLVYRYAAQMKTPNSLIYHPYIDWWSHHATTADMQRAVTFPDWIAESPQIVMVEGDFTTVFAESASGGYDVIVTFFFIDTARNLMAYIETIHRLLRKGGTWINLGPLLYGTGPWLQLSVDEIVKLSEEVGFDFDTATGDQCGQFTPGLDGKVRSLYVPYAQNPKGLGKNAYEAQFWRAVKR